MIYNLVIISIVFITSTSTTQSIAIKHNSLALNNNMNTTQSIHSSIHQDTSKTTQHDSNNDSNNITNNKNKLNIIQKLTFSYIKPFILISQKRPLLTTDLLTPKHTYNTTSSETFLLLYNKQLQNIKIKSNLLYNNSYTNIMTHTSSSSSSSHKSTPSSSKLEENLLLAYYRNPLIKTLFKIYRKEFIVSGIYKLIKTILQLTPPILISYILSTIDSGTVPSATSSPHMTPLTYTYTLPLLTIHISNIHMKAYTYIILLFLNLCIKTILDNQFFYKSILLASVIQCTLSEAVYIKALNLAMSSRQNNTVCIYNVYMYV